MYGIIASEGNRGYYVLCNNGIYEMALGDNLQNSSVQQRQARQYKYVCVRVCKEGRKIPEGKSNSQMELVCSAEPYK